MRLSRCIPRDIISIGAIVQNFVPCLRTASARTRNASNDVRVWRENKMRRNEFNLFTVGFLATGLLLLPTPSALAQMGGAPNGTQPNGLQQNGMQQNGMAPDGMPPEGFQTPGAAGAQDSEHAAERNIYGNIRRNIYVETQLSKLAEKHTGNADIKKFADQVISDNRRLEGEVTLPPSNDGTFFSPEVPSNTRQAEKQMKKLSGPQFDQIYLVQMDAYIKNDQQAASRASSMTGSSDLGEAGMRTRTLADERAKEISQLTAEENFKIK